MNIYVARQPILKKNRAIYAYELLFRDSLANFIPDVDGDFATSMVLSSSFLSIGIEAITGGRRAFINFTENLLIKKIPLMFPKEKTVIEMLENIEVKEIIIDICKEMKKHGYIIALDDFVYSVQKEPLISLVDIVKFDFNACSIEEIKESAQRFPSHVKLLAEKIETYEIFRTAQDMGFDYFQGYFFCRPEILQAKELSGSQMNLLQIMAEANKPEVEFRKIEDLILHDITISYKLLRYINSAHFMRRREISSIKEAIIYLGEEELRRFISLIAMSNLAAKKPNELIMTSCIRAKFCELCAHHNNNKRIKPWELFTVGLFSLIDAILDQPIEIIMKKLPLNDTITNTLIHKSGELSHYLRLIENFENGLWNELKKESDYLGINEAELLKIYSNACAWANSIV
ncbi:MAG: EAL and HDOD domain-containing protein [bacterium]